MNLWVSFTSDIDIIIQVEDLWVRKVAQCTDFFLLMESKLFYTSLLPLQVCIRLSWAPLDFVMQKIYSITVRLNIS